MNELFLLKNQGKPVFEHFERHFQTRTSQKTFITLAAAGAIALLVLTGCSSAATGDGSDRGGPAEAPSETTQRSMIDDMIGSDTDIWVKVVDVIDTATVRVVPVDSDENPLTGNEFTMPVTYIDAPQSNDCGFEEPVAWAKKDLMDKKSLHFYYNEKQTLAHSELDQYWGSVAVSSYTYDPVVYGYALPAEGKRVESRDNAKEFKRGLFSSCPGYGG